MGTLHSEMLGQVAGAQMGGPISPKNNRPGPSIRSRHTLKFQISRSFLSTGTVGTRTGANERASDRNFENNFFLQNPILNLMKCLDT